MRVHRSVLTVPVAAVLALCAAATAHAEGEKLTRRYCGFQAADFGGTKGLIQLNGDAKPGASEILLTGASPLQTGTAFYVDPLDLAGTELHVYFKARIDPAMMAATGGHGFTFMIQNNSPFSVGSNLDGLGFGGIKPSVIFEWDTTIDDEPSGQPPPYLAMVLDGDQTTHHSAAIATIDPLNIHAWVDYDPTDHFKIYVSNTETKPMAPVMWETFAGDAPKDLDLDAQIKKNNIIQGFLGFSAATGVNLDKSSAHHILAWEFSNKGVPCACQPATACKGFPKTPACSIAQREIPDGEIICKECNKDDKSLCTADKPVCHSKLEQCVECENNSDCKGGAPVCDKSTNTCAGCTSDADCKAFADRPYCETAEGPKKGTCQPCLEHEHCKEPKSPICLESGMINKCVPCEKDAECAARDPGAPHCDVDGPKTGQCEPCAKHADCKEEASPICDEAVEPSACRPCKTNPECKALDPASPYCVPTGEQAGRCTPDCNDACCGVPCNCATNKCCRMGGCPPTCAEGKPCDCATGECCDTPAEQQQCCDAAGLDCNCATLECCFGDDLAQCQEARIVGGGCACSAPGGGRATAALGLAAALAALGGLARRIRRSR